MNQKVYLVDTSIRCRSQILAQVKNCPVFTGRCAAVVTRPSGQGHTDPREGYRAPCRRADA
jgi:hypothetical protein